MQESELSSRDLDRMMEEATNRLESLDGQQGPGVQLQIDVLETQYLALYRLKVAPPPGEHTASVNEDLEAFHPHHRHPRHRHPRHRSDRHRSDRRGRQQERFELILRIGADGPVEAPGIP